MTRWKRLWCWEGLGAGGEGDDRGWDGWMASLTRWTWIWVNSGSWWWTERPSVLQFMGSQRVRHDWATELNWTELAKFLSLFHLMFLNLPRYKFKSWFLQIYFSLWSLLKALWNNFVTYGISTGLPIINLEKQGVLLVKRKSV